MEKRNGSEVNLIDFDIKDGCLVLSPEIVSTAYLELNGNQQYRIVCCNCQCFTGPLECKREAVEVLIQKLFYEKLITEVEFRSVKKQIENSAMPD